MGVILLESIQVDKVFDNTQFIYGIPKILWDVIITISVISTIGIMLIFYDYYRKYFK